MHFRDDWLCTFVMIGYIKGFIQGIKAIKIAFSGGDSYVRYYNPQIALYVKAGGEYGTSAFIPQPIPKHKLDYFFYYQQ